MPLRTIGNSISGFIAKTSTLLLSCFQWIWDWLWNRVPTHHEGERRYVSLWKLLATLIASAFGIVSWYNGWSSNFIARWSAVKQACANDNITQGDQKWCDDHLDEFSIERFAGSASGAVWDVLDYTVPASLYSVVYGVSFITQLLDEHREAFATMLVTGTAYLLLNRIPSNNAVVVVVKRNIILLSSFIVLDPKEKNFIEKTVTRLHLLLIANTYSMIWPFFGPRLKSTDVHCCFLSRYYQRKCQGGHYTVFFMAHGISASVAGTFIMTFGYDALNVPLVMRLIAPVLYPYLTYRVIRMTREVARMPPDMSSAESMAASLSNALVE